MGRPTTNRPFRFGERDRREFIVTDCEVAIQAENDADGNAIYVGRAKAGADTADEVWQIRSIAYDANNSVTSVTWPENDENNASTDYEFAWDDRATYTYS